MKPENTFFASPERMANKELLDLIKSVKNSEIIRIILETIAGFAWVGFSVILGRQSYYSYYQL